MSGPGPDAAAIAAASRRAAGLFALPTRGIVEVAGGDRVRWLDGMLSSDVTRLAPGPERSGCRALALTRKGGILADLRVWLRAEALWLETDAAAIPGLLEQLGRLVVADDVRLARVDAAVELYALEGPAAPRVVERAAGRELRLAPGAVADLEIADAEVAAAAYGASGEPALRLALPAGARPRVVARLAEVGRALDLVDGSAEAFEILRIEAGTPRWGAELGDDVLPAEARLEAAIAFDKGCYTGQEIVARVASRGRVRRHLVGLRLDGGAAPAAGDPIEADGARVGAITSGCLSPHAGAIGLGFARIPHDEPGGAVRVGARAARVVALPFVRPADAEAARARG